MEKPKKVARRTKRTERAEELRRLHAAGDDAWWGRPDTDTVKAVWRLVAPTLPDELKRLAPDFTARQVLTVALARCIQVGGEPAPTGRRPRRQTFSRNHLFDAVAPKWSRTFKTIAEVGQPGLAPTPQVYAQRRSSAEEARRQLLAVGVRLAEIWKIIAGQWSNGPRSKQPGTNPFFYLTRPRAQMGYRVHLRDTAELAELRRLLPPAPDRSIRLLLDSDPWPPRMDRYGICAERPYNGVEEDEAVCQILDVMERTRLRFNAREFKGEYDRWQQLVDRIARWKRRVPFDRRGPFARRVRVARRLQIDLDAYRRVRGQVETLPDRVLVKTRVFRDQEGRFHAAHFWPPHVGGRLAVMRGPRWRYLEVGHVRMSQRGRWFTHPDGHLLGGYDVASSQTQILSVLLGLSDLEELTRRRGFSMKTYLAERARTQLPMRGKPSTADLVRVMKDLWTRVLYGGHLKEIVWDHFDVFVPGAFTKAEYLAAVRTSKRQSAGAQARALAQRYNDAIKEGEGNLRRFLEDIPWYGKPGERKLSDFFAACQQIAKVAMERDLYAGVWFLDPLAGTLIRWNPPRRGRVRMNCQGLQVALRLPGGWSRKQGRRPRRFIDAIPHPTTGDYPVGLGKLKQAVAPGVVHLLDAMFNALVVLRLDELGAQDVVALHDCWMGPVVVQPDPTVLPPGMRAIRGAISTAGREWLERLGAIYVRLESYLRGTDFGPWITRLREDWEERVRLERWPDFRVEPTLGWSIVAVEALRPANVPQSGEEPAGPPPANVSQSGEEPAGGAGGSPVI